MSWLCVFPDIIKTSSIVFQPGALYQEGDLCNKMMFLLRGKRRSFCTRILPPTSTERVNEI